ncbi:glycerate kinase type-2 family protein [Haloplanus salilacus]|uniref:glycerate kinase type-2 family protein n=1 Tax=Haloplanus salilacus TaxID=2949994 RepID=UPI0030D2525D
MVSIDNEAALASTPARETALACLRAGIDAARPDRVVADSVRLDGDVLHVGDATYDLAGVDRIVVVGGGKAADGVATALEGVLGDRIDAGVVVTPDPGDGDRIDRVRGHHPVPSAEGVAGTDRIRDIVSDAGERTLVLAVITGGGSALLPAPAEGISLDDLRRTTDALLDAGAEIGDLNAVRKHLSTLKGGGLAQLAAPATVASLVFSDVVGNDLSVIASGPAAPDDSTYEEAFSVLDRYGVDPPAAVRDRLDRGAAGDLPETPGPDDPVFERVANHVLADAFTAIDAARSVARDRGYGTCVLSSSVRGEAREAALTHVAVAEEVTATGNPVDPPAVVLSGGETTATVRGDGVGGPNGEFALSAAVELPDSATLACVDTDGRDGSSDFAGAVVDGDTVSDTDAARRALADSDAFGHLGDRDAAVTTGPTGTNVNDLRVLVVE